MVIEWEGRGFLTSKGGDHPERGRKSLLVIRLKQSRSRTTLTFNYFGGKEEIRTTGRRERLAVRQRPKLRKENIPFRNRRKCPATTGEKEKKALLPVKQKNYKF